MTRHHAHRSRRPRPARLAFVAAAAVAAAAILIVAPAVLPRRDGGLPVGFHPATAAGQEPTVAPSDAPAGPATGVEPATGVGTGVTGGAGVAGDVTDPRRPYLVGPIEPPAIDPALAAAHEAPPPGRPGAAGLTGYVWPLAHPRLTLPFGPTPWGSLLVDGERFHDGIDLATFCGDRVMAAHDGRVLVASRHFDRFLGWVGDLGPYLRRMERDHLWMELPIVVVVDDGNGYRSVYAHFSKVVVAPGQRVHAGQRLGIEGMTGHASGCHVHYDLFSPTETATFGLRPDIAKRMHLPRAEIARIDPLPLLPPRRGINAPAFPPPNLAATP